MLATTGDWTIQNGMRRTYEETTGLRTLYAKGHVATTPCAHQRMVNFPPWH